MNGLLLTTMSFINKRLFNNKTFKIFSNKYILLNVLVNKMTSYTQKTSTNLKRALKLLGNYKKLLK